MIDPKAVETDRDDYLKRRDAAQQQANAAQAALQNATREVIAYDAAAQACAKLLEAVPSTPDTKADPAS